MSKEYTLAGEAFFKKMMRPEEERRQHLVVNNQWGGIGNGSLPSNVVSFQDYKQQHTQRERPREKKD